MKFGCFLNVTILVKSLSSFQPYSSTKSNIIIANDLPSSGHPCRVLAIISSIKHLGLPNEWQVCRLKNQKVASEIAQIGNFRL